eukprot:GHVT01024380.1.p1 GENE.GHVT01024380.1~~GHVT01024380.1.p1  ORF type:complete len:147 (+),score=16.00 GHVT01024380.1:865-1305(+)
MSSWLFHLSSFPRFFFVFLVFPFLLLLLFLFVFPFFRFFLSAVEFTALPLIAPVGRSPTIGRTKWGNRSGRPSRRSQTADTSLTRPRSRTKGAPGDPSSAGSRLALKQNRGRGGGRRHGKLKLVKNVDRRKEGHNEKPKDSSGDNW